MVNFSVLFIECKGKDARPVCFFLVKDARHTGLAFLVEDARPK